MEKLNFSLGQFPRLLFCVLVGSTPKLVTSVLTNFCLMNYSSARADVCVGVWVCSIDVGFERKFDPALYC